VRLVTSPAEREARKIMSQYKFHCVGMDEYPCSMPDPDDLVKDIAAALRARLEPSAQTIEGWLRAVPRVCGLCGHACTSPAELDVLNSRDHDHVSPDYPALAYAVRDGLRGGATKEGGA